MVAHQIYDRINRCYLCRVFHNLLILQQRPDSYTTLNKSQKQIKDVPIIYLQKASET